MNADVHVKFCGFVDLFTMILSTVHKEAAYYTFTDVCVLVILIDAVLLVVYIDLDTLEEAC